MKANTSNPIELLLMEAEAKKARAVSHTKEAEPIKDSDGILSQIVAEENRFFIISMILLLVGCLGGVAVGLGAGGNTIQTALLIFPVMATLSLLLAVQPLKYIVFSAGIAMFIDLAVIISNLL